MKPNNLTVGSVWTYKSREYVVTKVNVPDAPFHTKDPDSGRWHPAVSYEPIDAPSPTPTPETYVRQEADFLAKFEEVTH